MFAELSGVDIAAIITALGVFVTTVVGAIVTLRHEFAKAVNHTDSKIDAVLEHTDTKIDAVQTTVDEIKNTVNGA
jgi:hypothetical protein